MPLHLNPAVKGKYIKIGAGTWVKLSDISQATVVIDGNGRHLRVIKKSDLGKPLLYRGNQIDYVKTVLDRELP